MFDVCFLQPFPKAGLEPDLPKDVLYHDKIKMNVIESFRHNGTDVVVLFEL